MVITTPLTFAATVKGADVILKVQRPTEAELKRLAKGQKLFCIMSPYNEPAIMEALAGKGVDAFAMEFMPRIYRAQTMDVLSSQATWRATRRCSRRPTPMAAPSRR